MSIRYAYGVYDILRAKDLDNLDKKIQLTKKKENSYFGLGIYDSNLCEAMGIDKPLKSVEDRMKIMEQIRGVDFVFPVSSLNPQIVQKRLKTAYNDFLEKLEDENKKQKGDSEKKYDIGYAPGTYDLFHAGHLENLQIAAEQSKILIVGIKSNELVEEHKKKSPILSDEERMEIIRHFKFVHDVYKYYTRNLYVANDWIKSKYGKEIGAVFLGSDLKNDFKDVDGINIVYTPRDFDKMKTRSTTAYRKKIKNLNLFEIKEKKYYGKISQKEMVKSAEKSEKEGIEKEFD